MCTQVHFVGMHASSGTPHVRALPCVCSWCAGLQPGRARTAIALPAAAPWSKPPALSPGPFWPADGVLAYNQDAHRQRTVDWCDATGGTAAAFDFTLKVLLGEEHWLLTLCTASCTACARCASAPALLFICDQAAGRVQALR